jgi:two-component system KDP operon response regulator KdpE
VPGACRIAATRNRAHSTALILFASNLAREADAFAALFTSREWANQICRSVSDCLRVASVSPPHIVILRHRLADGYSDDVLKFLGDHVPRDGCRVVVLAPANFPTEDECRQLELGADHVFRDPVRVEMLIQLISRYRNRYREDHLKGPNAAACYEFCGASVYPAEHRLVRGRTEIRTTPKIIELVQVLHHNAGRLVSYTVLYDVLFARRFAGETANCRVLLAKADAVFRQLGVSLRAQVQVVPKSGYLYDPARNGSSHRTPRKTARR